MFYVVENSSKILKCWDGKHVDMMLALPSHRKNVLGLIPTWDAVGTKDMV